MTKPIKILAISGSLRSNSSNTYLVKAIASIVPKHIEYIIYKDMANIPLFDESDQPPVSVTRFRELLAAVDGILICSPEYAFGVSGVLKNAIDWTVSSGEFYDKPVAIITAAVNGDKAHAALLNILDALAAKVVEGGTLVIPFVRSKLNKNGEITDNSTLMSLKSVLDSLIKRICDELE